MKRLGLMGLLLLLLALLGACQETPSPLPQGGDGLSERQARETLAALLTKVTIRQGELQAQSGEEGDWMPEDALPPVTPQGLSVQGAGDIVVEILSSTEKAGEGMDGWLNQVALSFNEAGFVLEDGRSLSVSIRPVASGLAMDYILGGQYLPDAYTPATALWGDMLAAAGVPVTLREARLVGNTAGILMSPEAHKMYQAQYGQVTLDGVLTAVLASDLQLGYTNPYTSSAGLNLLTAMLQAFSPDNPLSAEAVARLTALQATVPPISYTTAQMRETAKNGGINAMVMEYQAYINEPGLAEYVYTPCGVRHDNPLYTFSSLSPEKEAALAEFIAYCKGEAAQALATAYGFNAYEAFPGDPLKLTGQALFEAQQVWKAHKDGGQPVVAVFLADTSASMEGEALVRLKSSLHNAAAYVDQRNAIGLVSFDEEVVVQLPAARFSGPQQAAFHGAVSALAAGGGAAPYDAVLAGLSMLLEKQAEQPNARLMLFLLSDGAQTEGYSLSRILPLVQALDIPIHTISYNADLTDLQQLAAQSGGLSIHADQADVGYQLRSIFNAQM